MPRREWLINFQDLIGPSGQWPRAIRPLFFARNHLTNRERFTVVIFLLANGVNPVLIREFFSEVFPGDNWRYHVDYLIRRYPSSNWMAWNVALNRSV